MASLGKLGGLSDDEYADLEERVDRFYNSWAPDGSTDLEPFLPPVGVRHRPVVLVEMIKTDMGRRARAGLSIRVEPYLARFRSDIPPDATPVSLLVEEFRLRQQYADRPAVAEYRSRFPTVAEAFARQLTDTPADEPQPPRSATIGLGTHDTSRDAPIVPDKTRKTDVLPPPSRKKPTTPSPDPTEVLPADLQYKLLGKLGQGTFGEVFEAIAPGGFPVAVKRILRAVDHPASQGEIEALDAMKTLAHPFLLQTHAYWVFRDRLVIVMELADGSLAGRIEHHKAEGRAGVPPTELIPLFEQAAEALDYLHSQNVSHRDLKPENLLLLKGYMKVADFGLARVHEHQMTVVVAEVGTPCYMAPEVWQRKVSLHSDQYSLAATYVSSRLGRPPFAGQTLHELCLQHLQEAPNLDGLPPDERRVLMKALAKSPTDRYPNCKAFVSALRAVVLPAARPKQRWAVWVALTAAAMALAVGLAVGVMWKLRPDTPPSGTGPGPDPQPVPVWSAPKWTIPPGAKTTPLPNGLVVPDLLTRVVGGETLELVLILPKPDQPDDPPAFYMLRNKVTNRVCRAVWQELEAGANSRLKRFRHLLPPVMEKLLLPEVWRQGAVVQAGDQDSVPVVGVTAPEAILVAEELGGRLPTLKQWRKAVGANGEDPRPGPTGESDGFARTLAGTTGGFGMVFASRPLALGVLAPWPVDKPTADRSIYGIHQLTSNGFEWADNDEPHQIDPFTNPGQEHRLTTTGETWETLTLPTFKRIAGEQRRLTDWTDTAELIGFRIVVTPK